MKTSRSLTPNARSILFFGAAFALLALRCEAADAPATPLPEIGVMPSFPIDARLVNPVSISTNAEQRAATLPLVLCNTTTMAGRFGVAMTLQTLVVRSVSWDGVAITKPAWFTLRAGGLTLEKDGTVRFKSSPLAPGVLPVEGGLLLPGETMVVDVPGTSEPAGPHDLVIEYGVVTMTADWSSTLLLLESNDGVVETYAPATDAMLARRNGNGGGPAVLRALMAEGGTPPKIITRTLLVGPPASPPSSGKAPAADASIVHRLNWSGYDGTGDPANAIFVLDDKEVGRGADGFAEVRRQIEAMPQGSRLVIVPYYGDPTGPKRTYPFDLETVLQHAERRGVRVEIPQAG